MMLRHVKRWKFSPEPAVQKAPALAVGLRVGRLGFALGHASLIESVFATVRHRTVRTKGALSPTTARLMVFKLIMAAAKGWRRLKGETQLPKVVAGVTFRDGTEVIARPDHRAA